MSKTLVTNVVNILGSGGGQKGVRRGSLDGRVRGSRGGQKGVARRAREGVSRGVEGCAGVGLAALQ
eukprot:939263-Prorocentrum_minimum.AAC.1